MKNKRVKNWKFFKLAFFPKNKKGVATEYLPWLIIALAILAIIMISIFIFKEKGVSLIDQIKNIFSGK